MNAVRRGRIALVAGGTRGIGLALVSALADHWSDVDTVYLTGRRAGDAERALSHIGWRNARIDWLPLDLAEADGPARIAATLADRHGGIDVAIMNGAFAPTHDAPPERDARIMIETNNHGALRFLRAMVPILRENGRLAVTASGFGLLKNMPDNLKPLFDTRVRSVDEIDATMDDYVAAAEAGRLAAEGWPAWINIPSKVGQVAVTRAFAKAYRQSSDARDGVLINAVCPGLTLTDATVGLMDNVFKGRAAQTPEEAASHLLWLLTLPAQTKEPFGELVQQRRILPFGD